MRRDRRRRLFGAVTLAAVLALAACTSQQYGPGPSPFPTTGPTSNDPATDAAPDPAAAAPTDPATESDARYSKVMIIAEENQPARAIFDSPEAPYINSLGRDYGIAENMNADYPENCPSLAAYLLLTSGSRHDICDDLSPSHHRLFGDNIFRQVAAGGEQWRAYAELMPGDCGRHTSSDELYLPRHVPSGYYASEDGRCQQWTVPLGTPTDGALAADLAAGDLAAFSFVTPHACNDMHGAPSCTTNLIAEGDRWLSEWVPRIMQSPDFRAGRLVVFITWDEGNSAGNHIPAIVVSPTTRSVRSAERFNHCSTLRTTEEILGLPLIGCATDAKSMKTAFGL